MPAEATSSAVTMMLVACGLSFVSLSYLFQKHVGGQSLLAYEPRRRVPWGPLVALLAMGVPLLSVLAFFTGAGEPKAEAEKVSAEAILNGGWTNITVMFLFIVGMTAWLVAFFRADAHDLGLPTSWKQFAKDVGIGMFAAVAALLPIYVIQLSLIYALNSNTPHPLVEQLQENHSPAMLLLGFVMAVIAAPLFEEFVFRGLFQGWLERREDEILAYDDTLRQPKFLDSGTENSCDIGNRRGVARRLLDDLPEINEATSFQLEPETTNPDLTPPVPTSPLRPAHGWISDLPHGWTPILISGFAFGLAHIGHGVAPISLILFGIVLGYLYQRTHRIVPSITAHMLFNAYSMVLLWLQLQS